LRCDLRADGCAPGGPAASACAFSVLNRARRSGLRRAPEPVETAAGGLRLGYRHRRADRYVEHVSVQAIVSCGSREQERRPPEGVRRRSGGMMSESQTTGTAAGGGAGAADPALHRMQYMPDLLIRALDRNADRPALYLGDVVLTAGELRDRISCFTQALESSGVGKGTKASILSKNRPEVLISMGATIIAGCRNTALSPTVEFEAHRYIIDDAQIEMLVFDPRHYEERAAQLRDACPTLTTLLSLGPSEVGTDILALAD